MERESLGTPGLGKR